MYHDPQGLVNGHPLTSKGLLLRLLDTLSFGIRGGVCFCFLIVNLYYRDD